MAATNLDVVHAWAHNLDKHKNGSNLYHYAGRLRSYSTTIGQRIRLNGKIIFLIDTASYSNTTMKHQSCMRMAIPRDEDNVYTFHTIYGVYGRLNFVDLQHSNTLIQFGLQLLLPEFSNCLKMPFCKKLDYKFSYDGYNEMVRFFEVTGVTTVSKLLRMKAKDLEDMARAAAMDAEETGKVRGAIPSCFRRFLRMMSRGIEIPTIVDLINGKGTWEAYLERTKGLRVAQKNRRLTEFCGFGDRWYRASCHTRLNDKITQKAIEKHQKTGDLIQWLVSIRRKNFAEFVKTRETCDRHARECKAKHHLEEYLGMKGFSTRWGFSNMEPKFSSFNYNGTVINFAGTHCYDERGLSDSEYREFVECSNKDAWIRTKRQWMLERLREDEQKEAAFQENIRCLEAEKERDCELSSRVEYIAEQKSLGAEGYRRLYHEGFRIVLPHDDEGIYDGGNVLLRFNSIRNVIETSKGIKIKLDEAKRLWKIFQHWHQNNEYEKGFEIFTTMTNFKVHTFQNNILTAGCHQIAFSEMQYIANQMNW